MSHDETRARAMSVMSRLKTIAQRTGRPVAELLELYAVERFLHRLGCSVHRAGCVLKGALLLREWLGASTRPTRDIDLLGPSGLAPEALRDAIAEILRAIMNAHKSSLQRRITTR